MERNSEEYILSETQRLGRRFLFDAFLRAGLRPEGLDWRGLESDKDPRSFLEVWRQPVRTIREAGRQVHRAARASLVSSATHCAASQVRAGMMWGRSRQFGKVFR